MSTILAKTFTKTLTDDVFEVDSEMGLTAISVFCNSTTGGTVQGNSFYPASDAITIDQDTSFNFALKGTGVIEGLTITAPSGCTLLIIGQIGG